MSDKDKEEQVKATYRKRSLFPKILSQCIEPLTRPVFKAKGLAGTKLLTEWPNVVGKALADRAIPEKLSFPQGKTTGGTLTIAVQNGFATELQHMQPVILERLSTYFGYKAVDRIMISHSFVPAMKPKVAAKNPLKPSLPAGSAALADQIEDGELKAALKSFASALSGQET